MIRAALVCALLCTVGTIAPAVAGDRPIQELKDVKIVHYVGLAEDDKSRCATDMGAWNTAIDFVANQSTKLKLIREVDYLKQVDQLYNEVIKARESFWSNTADEPAKKEASEAEQRWRKFLDAPWMFFTIRTMEIINGCIGTVDVRVSAKLEPSKIIATDKFVQYPDMIIWRDSWLLIGPDATFAIRRSEELLKSFVNDCARSQE
jgi:hypothetical protein